MKCNWKSEFKGVKLDRPSQAHQNAANKSAVNHAIKWMREEVLPQMTENFMAVILWQLHERHGHSKKWLENFIAETTPMLNDLLDYYEYDTDADALWICKYKLRTELGIDLSQKEVPFKATLKEE